MYSASVSDWCINLSPKTEKCWPQQGRRNRGSRVSDCFPTFGVLEQCSPYFVNIMSTIIFMSNSEGPQGSRKQNFKTSSRIISFPSGCCTHCNPKNNTLKCATKRHFRVLKNPFFLVRGYPVSTGVPLPTPHTLCSPNFKLLPTPVIPQWNGALSFEDPSWVTLTSRKWVVCCRQ